MNPDVECGKWIKRLFSAIKPGVLIWLLALSINLLIRKPLEQSNASALGGWITLMVCLVAIRLFSARALQDHEAPGLRAGFRLGIQFLIFVAGLDALFLGWASKQGLRYLAAGQPVLGLLYLECLLIPALGGIVEERRRLEEAEE